MNNKMRNNIVNKKNRKNIKKNKKNRNLIYQMKYDFIII